MGFLGILLMVVFVITSLLLVLVVLVQDEGGDGLGGIFGGGGGSSQVGNRSGNILTRITSVLAAVFLLSSFGLAWINRTPDSGDVEAAARRLEAGDGQTVEWWVSEDEAEEEIAE